MEENEKGSDLNYPYPNEIFSNTLDVKIDGVQRLMEEKILNLKDRIDKIEKGEVKKEDRKFQLFTLVFGAILGAALTIIVQSVLKIIK